MKALVSSNKKTPVFGFLSVRNHEINVSFNKKYLVCHVREGEREGGREGRTYTEGVPE
jgi:hypothetical protein